MTIDMNKIFGFAVSLIAIYIIFRVASAGWTKGKK